MPNYAEGRNAADITLIIEAVDLLNCKRVDGFCIVSSDNHFAGLVRRIRKEDAFVVGIGSSYNPPTSFMDACNDFRYIEDLPTSPNPDPASQKALSEWKDAVKEAIHMSALDGGWVLLSMVGTNLGEIGSDIDPHIYCHGQLLSLVESCPEFEVESDHVRLRSPKTG